MKKQDKYGLALTIITVATLSYLGIRDIQRKQENYSRLTPSPIEQIVKEPIKSSQKGLLEIMIPEN